jgi:hypothetical protein
MTKEPISRRNAARHPEPGGCRAKDLTISVDARWRFKDVNCLDARSLRVFARRDDKLSHA